MQLEVTITVDNQKSYREEMSLALKEVAKKVEAGFSSGFEDTTEGASYSFEMKGFDKLNQE